MRLMDAFVVSTIFFDYQEHIVILVLVSGVAWLLLTIFTDRQERILSEKLDGLTDEEYVQFFEDAEERG